MAAMSGVLGKVALRRQMWRRPTVVRQVDIDREVHRLPNSDREDHATTQRWEWRLVLR